jgi:hypothetical protein
MQYILSLLPLLACPVGMGLMMWLMMRRTKQDQAPQRTDQLPASAYPTPVEATHESPRRSSALQMLFMCLNWKVVAGLAVVGVIVWAVAPQLLLGAIPLLIVAACPLSMLLMMRGMHSGGERTVRENSGRDALKPVSGERKWPSQTLRGMSGSISRRLTQVTRLISRVKNSAWRLECGSGYRRHRNRMSRNHKFDRERWECFQLPQERRERL